MNLRHVKAFVAVADAGSIRGAARALGVTQPAVTKAIQQLEASLGVKLMVRNVAGVALTSSGLRFLARARLIVEELGRAHTELKQLGDSFEGTVSIGLAPTVGELVAPQVVPAFHERHPKVKVRISGGLPSSTIYRVCDGSFDFVIGPRPLQAVPPMIDSWRLYMLDVGITVRKGHPLAHAKSLAEFASTPWVLTQSTARPDSPLANAFAGLGLEGPYCPVQSESLVAAQAFVAATNWAALMPRLAVELGAMRDQLRVVEVPELSISNSIEIFFRREPPLTPAALELANAFRGAAVLHGPA